MTQRIQELTVNVWRTERMPNEWNKWIICPIYSVIQKDWLNFVSLYFKIRTNDKYDVN
jgi:hypothetical protein